MAVETSTELYLLLQRHDRDKMKVSLYIAFAIPTANALTYVRSWYVFSWEMGIKSGIND